MIAEFDKNVTYYVNDDVTKVWTQQKPFPLKESISNNLISIDKAFAINNLTLSLQSVEVPIGLKLGQVESFPFKTNRYYIGQLDSFIQPHGVGRLIGDKTWIYEGQFRNGLANGYGRFIDVGQVYTGQWQDGKFHGNGKL